MTNTINNVPRELLERAWRALANSATGREIGAYLDADPCAPECAETCARASMCSTCSAILSAPSPAGVDGLNTDRNAAFKACPESGCDWGSFYLGWKARGEVEQAIIDGLRGEVDQLQSMLATVSKAGIRVRTERDQQAQRIGELEGLLREVHDTYRAAIHWEDLRGTMKRIAAALSAGKDSER